MTEHEKIKIHRKFLPNGELDLGRTRITFNEKPFLVRSMTLHDTLSGLKTDYVQFDVPFYATAFVTEEKHFENRISLVAPKVTDERGWHPTQWKLFYAGKPLLVWSFVFYLDAQSSRLEIKVPRRYVEIIDEVEK